MSQTVSWSMWSRAKMGSLSVHLSPYDNGDCYYMVTRETKLVFDGRAKSESIAKRRVLGELSRHVMWLRDCNVEIEKQFVAYVQEQVDGRFKWTVVSRPGHVDIASGPAAGMVEGQAAALAAIAARRQALAPEVASCPV